MKKYKDALNKIQQESERQLEEKRLAEENRVKDELEKDREKLESLLEMIENRMLYRKVGDYTKKYEIVTPEILLHDYITQPESTYIYKGIRYNEDWNDNKNCHQSVVSVNGRRYYDMRYILYAYEKDVEDLRGKYRKAKEILDEVDDDLKKVNEEYPRIVKMMHEWAEFQAKNNEVTES